MTALNVADTHTQRQLPSLSSESNAVVSTNRALAVFTAEARLMSGKTNRNLQTQSGASPRKNKNGRRTYGADGHRVVLAQ